MRMMRFRVPIAQNSWQFLAFSLWQRLLASQPEITSTTKQTIKPGQSVTVEDAMPKTLPVPLTFYPAYCFSLSPTYDTWARLTIAEVHALKEREGFEGQNTYFHLNHPLKWIRLVGVIVAFDEFPTRWILLLDDSSGALIEVTCGRPQPPNTTTSLNDHNIPSAGIAKPTMALEGVTSTGRPIDLSGIDIGSVVKVKGKIGSFRGEKQMHLERISVVHTTTEEAAAWAENTAFRKAILDTPWMVSEKDERGAKRKAEGLNDEKNKREERKRRKRKAEVERKVSTMERERLKVVEERRRAAAEEERSRKEEAKRVAAEEEKQKMEEAKCLAAEEEKQRSDEAARVHAEIERRDRDKKRREHERKLREQEYSRLTRQSN